MGDLAGNVDIGALHLDGDVDALFRPRLGGGLGLIDHLRAPLGAAVGRPILKSCANAETAETQCNARSSGEYDTTANEILPGAQFQGELETNKIDFSGIRRSPIQCIQSGKSRNPPPHSVPGTLGFRHPQKTLRLLKYRRSCDRKAASHFCWNCQGARKKSIACACAAIPAGVTAFRADRLAGSRPAETSDKEGENKS